MENEKIFGYACAYTPLALMHAFGFRPYRVLPVGDNQDQAGRLLHDNLCPHVKRILDRAMSRDLPQLSGMIFMNSCDAMRRLYDAWQKIRPQDECMLIDLPTTISPMDVDFFEKELQRVSQMLAKIQGASLDISRLIASIQLYNQLAGRFQKLRARVAENTIANGAQILQEMYAEASTTLPETMVKRLDDVLSRPEDSPDMGGVPIYLFGNMMPEAQAFSMFESCGVRILGEDLCTGSRLFSAIAIKEENPEKVMKQYAQGILNRPPCARTMVASQPGKLARDVVAAAKEHQVKGVIGYTIKFCDPYIARLPGIRAALKEAELPFLMLEGDCTARTMGQQKTRIEAFIEMLK